MRPCSVWSPRRKRAARKNFIFGGLSKRRISSRPILNALKKRARATRSSAKRSIEAELKRLAGELPELREFMESCLPPYGNTLDELSVEGDWNENENVD